MGSPHLPKVCAYPLADAKQPGISTSFFWHILPHVQLHVGGRGWGYQTLSPQQLGQRRCRKEAMGWQAL